MGAEKATTSQTFRQELDELFKRTHAKLGAEDVAHVERVAGWSTRLEWIGRIALAAAFEPVTFLLGTVALWLHKQIELTGLGHTVQHGAYESIPGAERFHRERHHWRFAWRVPVHAPSWRHSHNRLHHGLTNVVGRDPDARLYRRRLQAGKRRWYHRLLVLETAINWPNIVFNANAAATGLFEVYTRKAGDLEILPDRSWRSLVLAHKRAAAGSLPYFLREYLFFPALMGPFYLKVLAGNWLSSLLRNLFTAPVLYAGHISPEVEIYAKDDRAASRDEWYERQVRSTQNFEVPALITVLVGGLNYQIEHHLFPSLPANRLVEIAPEVRRICEEHGIPYNSQPWTKTLGLVFRQLWELT